MLGSRIVTRSIRDRTHGLASAAASYVLPLIILLTSADVRVPQNFWVKDHRQVYLLGNPMVWWLSTAAVLAYVAVRGFLILRQKRGFRDFENSTITSTL